MRRRTIPVPLTQTAKQPFWRHAIDITLFIRVAVIVVRYGRVPLPAALDAVYKEAD
jgi:hypothetical protein